ncbi:proteinase-activated receptor 1-like [Narcine bancroftii]|uniref:proteinase-activated receptor 1-like n=1 Tax=Narcine bancroftii TaxID=1343680 RepID=UPI00383170B1
MDHLNNLNQGSSQKVTSAPPRDPLDTDYISILRRYLALKYLQYMILPSTNIVVMGMGAFGTLYVSVLLLSKTMSRKCTSVFISHLAAADVLLIPVAFIEICHQMINVKAESADFILGFSQNLVLANTYISATVLSCISLEAFLITHFPRKSCHLRTAKHARKTCMCVWAVVVTECIILQTENVTSYDKAALNFEKNSLSWAHEYLMLIAPVVRIFSDTLVMCFKFTNLLFYYKVYVSKSYSRHFSNS